MTASRYPFGAGFHVIQDKAYSKGGDLARGRGKKAPGGGILINGREGTGTMGVACAGLEKLTPPPSILKHSLQQASSEVPKLSQKRHRIVYIITNYAT